MQREGLAGLRRLVGNGHRDTLTCMLILAETLAVAGEQDAARQLRDEYLERSSARRGPRHPVTLRARVAAAASMVRSRDLEEAERLAHAAVEGYRATPATPKVFMVRALGTLALVRRERGRPDEALGLYTEIKLAHAEHAALLGPPEADLRIAHAECLTELERFADAQAEYMGVLGSEAGSDRWVRRRAQRGLAGLYAAWDRAEPGKGHDAAGARWAEALRQPLPARRGPAG